MLLCQVEGWIEDAACPQPNWVDLTLWAVIAGQEQIARLTWARCAQRESNSQLAGD